MITYLLERPVLMLFGIYVPLTWLFTIGVFKLLLALGWPA